MPESPADHGPRGSRLSVVAAHVRADVARRPWTWLVGVFVATRVLLVAQLLAFGDAFLPDVRLYATWTILLASGQFPVGDAYWQYPPGAGLLFAASRFAGPDPVFGFVVLALVADALLLTMLAVAGRRHWLRRGAGASADADASADASDDITTYLTGAWVWVVGGFAVGPVLLARFDVFPTLFAAAAVVLAARPLWSGIAAGAGGLLKVWPMLMLVAMRRRDLWLGLAAALGTIVVGVLAINAWAGGGVSFLGEQSARGLQIESVAAVPYLIGSLFGMPVEVVLRYGAFEIDAPGSTTAGLVLTAFGLLVIAAIGLLRVLGRLERASGGDVALLVLLVSIVTSRVFSPQYTAWYIGVAAAALLAPTTRVRRIAWWLVGVTALTQWLFPWAYGSLVDLMPWAIAMQLVRIAIVLGSTIVLAREVMRAASGRSDTRSASRALD